MTTEFLSRFVKDLKKITEQSILDDVAETIVNVEEANSIAEIRNIIKMKGYATAYRIRIGEYRIGIFIEDNVVQFARVVHRKDIYKYFP
jgi:mRNA interferase RelE/StbE